MDISALFPDMTQDQITTLMKQFMPNAEDEQKADRSKWAAIGLTLLANSRKGREFEALGQAGLAGMNASEQQLDVLSKRRGSAITQAQAALKMQKELQKQAFLQKEMARYASLGMGLPNTEPPSMPRPVGPQIPQPGAAPAFGSGAPDAGAPPMPPPGPGAGGPPPQQPPPLLPTPPVQQPNQLDANQRMRMIYELAGEHGMAETLGSITQEKVETDGAISQGGRIVGRMTKTGREYFDGRGHVPMSREALAAINAQIAEEERLKAEATQRAQARFATATTTGPDNRPRFGYVQNLLGPAPGEVPAGPQPGGRVTVNMQDADPQHVEKVLRAMTGNPAPTAVAPAQTGMVTGPDPSDIKARENFNADIQKEVAASKPVAFNAVQAINTAHNARQILDSGKVIAGGGAEWVTKFAQAMGFAGSENAQQATAATQAFAALMGQQVLGVAQQFKGNFSDADRMLAQSMVGANPNLDEASIRKIIDLNEKANRLIIRFHNSNSERGSKQLKIPEFNDYNKIDEPPEYVAPKRAPQLNRGAASNPLIVKKYAEAMKLPEGADRDAAFDAMRKNRWF